MGKYLKNECTVTDDRLFQIFLNNGTINLKDVMESGTEDMMKMILTKLHQYSIKRSTDGRYITYVPDETKTNGRRQIRKKSKAELYRYLLSFYGVEDQDTKSRMSYSELFREWIRYKEQFVKATNKKRSLSPTTIRRYERDYDNYIKGTPLETVFIRRVTTPQLQIMIKDIIQRLELSEKCAGNLIGYIRQSFQYARRSGYIETDPAEMIDRALLLSMCRFSPPKDDSEQVLTIKELVALRDSVISHEKAYPDYMPDYAVELAILTGMRVGELSALHWSDIDKEYIHIDFSEHRLDYKDRSSTLVIDEPKNGKHRRIQITEDISELLHRIKMNSPDGEKEFVFTKPDGARCTSHDISCAVSRRAQEAGIKRTSIHCIRRTVSSLLNTILPQKAVAEMLGHTERVNEQHYNFSTAENAEKLRALEEVSSKVINFKTLFQDKKTAINA